MGSSRSSLATPRAVPTAPTRSRRQRSSGSSPQRSAPPPPPTCRCGAPWWFVTPGAGSASPNSAAISGTYGRRRSSSPGAPTAAASIARRSSGDTGRTRTISRVFSWRRWMRPLPCRTPSSPPSPLGVPARGGTVRPRLDLPVVLHWERYTPEPAASLLSYDRTMLSRPDAP